MATRSSPRIRKTHPLWRSMYGRAICEVCQREEWGPLTRTWGWRCDRFGVVRCWRCRRAAWIRRQQRAQPAPGPAGKEG